MLELELPGLLSWGNHCSQSTNASVCYARQGFYQKCREHVQHHQYLYRFLWRKCFMVGKQECKEVLHSVAVRLTSVGGLTTLTKKAWNGYEVHQTISSPRSQRKVCAIRTIFRSLSTYKVCCVMTSSVNMKDMYMSLGKEHQELSLDNSAGWGWHFLPLVCTSKLPSQCLTQNVQQIKAAHSLGITILIEKLATSCKYESPNPLDKIGELSK